MNINAQALGSKALKILGKQKAIIAIAIMLIVMIFSDTNFYTAGNISNLLEAVSTNAIIAFGVTLAVICKGCDLSVGSVMVVSGIIAILLINSGMNMALAIVLAILSGSAVGFINGFLIVQQKSEAFIITLGMGMLVQGVALLLTDAKQVAATDPFFQRLANDNWLFIPNIAAFMIILGVLVFLLLRFTSFGRNCYALGGDYEVAEHSGINVIRTKWLAFVITGTFAAIAGVLSASRMNTGIPIAGVTIPLMVNCGVVIGGTSFAGGVGGIPQSFIGIFVMFLLRNCMGMLGIHIYIQQLVLGIMIVSIIALDCFAEKRKKEDV
ncbi:MAG: ABC transporter permease [Oscillospiraceae bacterium]|jgi:ribose/xylose/arabinose/galactoside ABC-type transport system permease subunit|nr:ABC transporter permease [Oscillospiraceae bacterium]